MTCHETDVAIVGAGILGLAHARLAAQAGHRVTVFERSPKAYGASIRNFGMIWPIGQSPGALHALALRSRELWLNVLEESGLPYFATGSLHATYQPEEAAVGREFSDKAPALGYDCAWLTPAEALHRSSALSSDGLLGALWSPTELTVDPRQIINCLPSFLSEHYGVEFRFNTAVGSVGAGYLEASGEQWKAGRILICAGDDFQTLFPAAFSALGLTRCKLQMLRTPPQPKGWLLGPSLAFGPTFRHYPTFRICETLDALKERGSRDEPQLDRWGIHIMVSQSASGELTLGDSHEYGLAVDIFDKPLIYDIILNYARRHLRVPQLETAEQWHGVYAKHPEHIYQVISPVENVDVVVVTSGTGMTLSFGIAQQVLSAASLI
jgi:FAD dependent oxidoreductase TIGR03364